MNHMQKTIGATLITLAAAAGHAEPPGGIYSELAERAQSRAEYLGTPTVERLQEHTAAVEAHLETHPEDVRNLDGIGKVVLRDTVGVLKDELIRQPLALGADAVRTVLRAFRPAREEK